MFREKHLINFLKEYSASELPVDAAMRNYCRAHRALGSKDRKWLAESVYEMIRWRPLIGDGPLETLYPAYIKDSWRANRDKRILEAFPKFLVDKLENAQEICRVSNTRAPTTIRINTMKTTPERFAKLWPSRLTPCIHSRVGFHVELGMNLLHSREYLDGLFEIQDEGSQLLAEYIDAKPGMHILDMCAGAGGKTLAFAPAMHNRGQIYLYDIRQSVLKNAKKRLARSGCQNIQFIDPEKKKIEGKRFDRILLDVPCSGTGTMRRNPDMKWRLTQEHIDTLVKTQREIFAEALPFLKKGGQVIYATCSLLAEENEEQIAYFQKEYGAQRLKEDFKSAPVEGGMDGFFAATLAIL